VAAFNKTLHDDVLLQQFLEARLHGSVLMVIAMVVVLAVCVPLVLGRTSLRSRQPRCLCLWWETR
jgi:hypothetical protein